MSERSLSIQGGMTMHGAVVRGHVLPYEVLIKQRDDEERWRALRMTGISASIVPEILGLFPPDWIGKYKRTREGVIADLAASKQETVRDEAVVECGQRCEPMVLGWASDLTGHLCLPWGELLRSKEWPWMLATPDGASRSEDGDILHEIKCTRYPWKDGLPEYVRAQVVAQLAVTGYPRAMVHQWSWGYRPVTYVVEREERLISAIVGACREAWEEVEAMKAKNGGGR